MHRWAHPLERFVQATPPVTTAMLAISALGTSPMVAAVALGTALHLVWRRAWYRHLALVLTVPGGMLLNVCLKLTFRRGRPTFAESLLVLTTYSFPSGQYLSR